MRGFDDLRSALRQLGGGMCTFDPATAPALVPTILDLSQGRTVSDGRLKNIVRMQAAVAASGQKLIQIKSGKMVALVSLHGVALYDLDYPPYCFSTRKLATTLKALANRARRYRGCGLFRLWKLAYRRSHKDRRQQRHQSGSPARHCPCGRFCNNTAKDPGWDRAGDFAFQLS